MNRATLLIITFSMIMVLFAVIPVEADSTSLENEENFSVTTSTHEQSLLIGSVSGYSLTAGDVLFISCKGREDWTLSPPRVYLLNEYQFQGWDYFRKYTFQDPASRGWLLRNDSWEMTLNYSITSSGTYYVIIDNPNWIPDILPPSIDIISYQAIQNYPNSYYLTVKTDPHDIVSIPGENSYLRGYDKILTAPFAVTVNSSFQYRFQYWDVDGVSYGIDVNTITVEMNSNHTATAHYVPHRLIEHDGSFKVKFSTRDPYWGTPHTLNGSINGYSLMTGQMLFVSWSIVAQGIGSYIPYIYLLDSYQVQGWYWDNLLDQGVASRGYLKLVESWQGTFDYQIAYLDSYYVIISNRNPSQGIVGKTPIDITSYDAYLALPASYYLSVKTDPGGVTSIPGEGWYSEGSNPVLSAPASISVPPDRRYRFEYWEVDGVSRGISVNTIAVGMNMNHTATAHYVLQYQITFMQAGLDFSATGSVMSVNGVSKTFGSLPYIFWKNNGSVIVYSYDATVPSSTTGKRFILKNVAGPTSPIIITGPTTVTGYYDTQTPPSAPVVNVTPDSPYTIDALTCTVTTPSSDIDGDTVAYTYEWFKDGILQPAETTVTTAFSDTVLSSKTKRDEEWKCVVTPNDGTDDGPTDEDSVTILNSPPVASNVEITPSVPNTTDDLVGSYIYSDADDDAESGSQIRWYKDDALQSGYNDQLTIPSSATSENEEWYFTVRPNDSTDFGDLVESNKVIIIQTSGPTAQFIWTPLSPCIGENVKFDASSSLPGFNGTHTMPITEYRWDFDDGGETTTFTPVVYHGFDSSGDYYVTLTVYAPGATPETDSITHKVTVASVPVGGYSLPIRVYTTTKPLMLYFATVAIFATIFTLIKRKTRSSKQLEQTL